MLLRLISVDKSWDNFVKSWDNAFEESLDNVIDECWDNVDESWDNDIDMLKLGHVFDGIRANTKWGQCYR